ncbi:MAG TPA: AMP-dependent synthetase/ligase [Terrimesophilobacter sp.]|nr:AMP-dependent synthetase/ligase [Terrimesophilobacter sp.]HRP99238.1 AMP-dependent synthetase/ligase [Terrimesophilobacter sp.]
MHSFATPALVPANPDANVTDLLVERVAETPNHPIFSIPAGDDAWKDVTAKEFLNQVTALAKGLVAAGIEPGDKVGFMCKTRYEWTLVDFAIWFAGAVMVPIYDTSAPSQIQWILNDSGAVAMIVETPEHFSKFDEVRADLPKVDKSWQVDLGDLDKLAASGKDVSDEEIERRRNLAKGSDLATLIYTAGTTGKPKGCMLSHANFYELSRNAKLAIPEVVNPDSSTVLFITLAHVFARFISVLAVHGGVKVGHQPDTKLLLPALGSFKPTFLLAVPRVFEKVYNSSEQKAETGGKGKIFRSAAAVAVEHSKALDAGKVPFGLAAKYALFNALVYKKIKAALGGRVKYAVSGSAPLGLFLAHFYRSMGMTILEGYGLTETTAPISVNLPSNFKIGKVGPPLPGCAIRVAADGELEASGINIFQGYFKNDQATKDSFDGEWFKTGDIGTIDDDGYIEVTGRKKEMIVTAGGKNVAPAVLEDPIRSDTIISQVVVVGDKRPFVGALVTLDEEMLPVWLNNNGEDAAMSIADASKNPKVLAQIQASVDRANKNVSRAESIRKFVVLPSDFTQESGHLTPKLSVKRNVVLEDFASVIDEMYAGTEVKTEGIATP